jgi:hypothetical protein
MRKFDAGSIRDSEEGKYDYEGALSPLVLERFAAYMHKHCTLADGSTRTSDNWQKGMPKDVYIKSPPTACCGTVEGTSRPTSRGH